MLQSIFMALKLLWNVQYAIRILDSNSPLELAESHMRLRLAVDDKQADVMDSLL